MTRPPLVLSSVVLLGALALVRPQAPAVSPQASAALEVPIGGIILWWGQAADIPAGFEACDGTTVTTRDAVLRGAKPDLQSKFPRGAANYRSFVPQAYAGGGSDTIKLDGSSVKVVIAPHRLTDAELPAHTHLTPELTHTPNDHSHSIAGHHHGMDHTHPGGAHTHDGIATTSITPATTSVDLDGTAGADVYLESFTPGTTTTGAVTTKPPFTTGSPTPTNTGDTPLDTTSTNGTSAANHIPTATSSKGTTGQILLNHQPPSVTATTLDNRPAFVDVVFLIRVK